MKGNMKSRPEDDVLHLCVQIVHDLHDTLAVCYDQLPSHPFNLSKERKADVAYVVRRCEAEGLGFALQALPLIGKFLDAYLGRKDSPAPRGFRPFDEHGYPLFLRSFWYLVRTYETSELGAEHLARSIQVFRTLSFGFYKLEVPFTTAQADKMQAAFMAAESDLSAWQETSDTRVTSLARSACTRALEGFNFQDAFCPRHGPGAVATGEKDEEKWTFKRLFPSAHQRFPYENYLYGIYSTDGERHHPACDLVGRMVEEPCPMAKIVFVPKDSRGPRIISAEPPELMFLQQGVARPLMAHLESQWPTRGHLNFTDQSINGALALSSSRDQRYATLDLREASDRVSIKLCELLLPESFALDVMSLRSHATTFPNGEVCHMKKYAPMGSALCFPVESLIFWAICVAALQSNGASFDVACARVYVYGDDLIVPTADYHTIVGALESYGLAVNESKSFADGRFRESCGVDAWNGFDVTPQRFRKLPGQGPSDGQALAAWASYASGLKTRGLNATAAYARSMVERVLGPIPRTRVATSYISFVDPSCDLDINQYRGARWDPASCYPVARLWRLKTARRKLQLDSWERLHMNLLGAYEEHDPSEVVAREATVMSKSLCTLTEYSIFDWNSQKG